MAVGGVGVVAPAAVEVAVPAALGGVAVAVPVAGVAVPAVAAWAAAKAAAVVMVAVVVVAVVAAAVDPAAGVDQGLNSQIALEKVEVDVATVGGRRLDRRWDRR